MTKASICTLCNGARYCLTNGKGGWAPCECFRCDQCKGDGYVYILDDKGLSYARECECAQFKKKLKKLNLAGIPEKFAQVSFASYSAPAHQSQKLAKTRAMDFVADFSKSSSTRGLLFMGSPGLGKTHLAVAIIKSLIMEKGIDCKFVDFFQLLSDIRNGFSNDVSEQTLINPYIKSQVLVIDELAKGRNTEWELTILDQIISIRYNASNKVTIFTTNYMSEAIIKNKHDEKSSHVDFERQNFSDLLTTQTLQERIGSRIYSRLAEMCDFVMIQGEDHRQQKLPKPQRFSRAKK